MNFARTAFFLVACSIGTRTANAQTTLSTPAPVRQIGMFSNTMHTSMGQSLTAPTDVNSLDSFTFWLNAHLDVSLYNPALTFRAYVMQWDATNEHVVGPVLFESALFAGPVSGMQRYDFATGGIAVTSGSSYLMFLSLLDTPTENSTTQYGVLMGYGYHDYTGGRWYAGLGGTATSIASLHSGQWTHDTAPECYDCDAAFIANFSQRATVVTPEPSTFTLLGAAFTILAIGNRRRRTSMTARSRDIC